MKVIATTRQTQGTSASRRLRRADKLPGIIYGGRGFESIDVADIGRIACNKMIIGRIDAHFLIIGSRNIKITDELLGRLYQIFGEKNVKAVEKYIENTGKMH